MQAGGEDREEGGGRVRKEGKGIRAVRAKERGRGEKIQQLEA